jgi:hypothetical protein
MRPYAVLLARATVYALCAYVLATAVVYVVGAAALATNHESPFRALERALKVK